MTPVLMFAFMEGHLYTVPEAAEFLRVSEWWLRDAVRRHAVPCTRVGRGIRFTQAHLDAIVSAGEQPIMRQSRTRARL